MKKNKSLPFIAIMAIAITLIISGCGVKIKKEKTVSDLVEHFKNSGLKVDNERETTDQEKEVVESAKKTLKAISVGEKSNVIEKGDYNIESAKVDILKYKDEESAKTAYDYYIGQEEREKKRSEEKNSPYFKSSHFLNGVFVMHIRYYDIKLVEGGIGAEKLNVNEEDVNKIKKSFEEFK